jgi:hypothetical protein
VDNPPHLAPIVYGVDYQGIYTLLLSRQSLFRRY